MLTQRTAHVDLGALSANPRVAIPFVVANASIDLLDSRPQAAYDRLKLALTRRSAHAQRTHSVWLDLVPWFGRAAAQTGQTAECRTVLSGAISELLADAELRTLRPLLGALYAALADCELRDRDVAAASTSIAEAVKIQAETETATSESMLRSRALVAQIRNGN